MSQLPRLHRSVPRVLQSGTAIHHQFIDACHSVGVLDVSCHSADKAVIRGIAGRFPAPHPILGRIGACIYPNIHNEQIFGFDMMTADEFFGGEHRIPPTLSGPDEVAFNCANPGGIFIYADGDNLPVGSPGQRTTSRFFDALAAKKPAAAAALYSLLVCSTHTLTPCSMRDNLAGYYNPWSEDEEEAIEMARAELLSDANHGLNPDTLTEDQVCEKMEVTRRKDWLCPDYALDVVPVFPPQLLNELPRDVRKAAVNVIQTRPPNSDTEYFTNIETICAPMLILRWSDKDPLVKIFDQYYNDVQQTDESHSDIAAAFLFDPARPETLASAIDRCAARLTYINHMAHLASLVSDQTK
jgi:hypothetical protein